MTKRRCKVPRCRHGGAVWTCRDCGKPVCKHHCGSKEMPEDPIFHPEQWNEREVWYATCVQCSLLRYQNGPLGLRAAERKTT